MFLLSPAKHFGVNLFRLPYSAFSNLNRAKNILAFSKPRFPRSAGMTPSVCLQIKYSSFKILCVHSHCPQWFSMPSLFIQEAHLRLQVPQDKTGPATLCSELRTQDQDCSLCNTQRWPPRERTGGGK